MSNELVKGSVDKVSFDYGVELLVEGAVLRIEGSALLGTGADAVEFDAESPAGVAEQLVKLLHEELRVSVSLDSELQFHSADDQQVLNVPPSYEYESWSATLSDGSKSVCGLDGNIAEWPSS